ncbi:hypothetical protein H0H92_003503 [Tricholoma furcatifolium]|nr:hypothetical protein H0H92_003503 [Tricholoma furcatifolium]
MIVAPAPSGARGEVILQPSYFSSSVFVKAVRDDITTLIHSYHEKYTKSSHAQPFALFKNLWCTQGWKWIHLIFFDDRPREMFLNIIHRLFLERMVKTEAPFTRAIALFGLYTFFSTQPQGTAPSLYSLSHIQIPLDQFATLKALPNSMNADHLQSLQRYVSYILSALLKDAVFTIIPSSDAGPLNPRDLPREIFVEEGAFVSVDLNAPKKKGRPTRREKSKKAKLGLDNLDKWLLDAPPLSSTTSTGSPDLHSPLGSTLRHYQTQKARILGYIDQQAAHTSSSFHTSMAIQKSNDFVLERLKAAEGLFSTELSLTHDNEMVGLTRVERAVKELSETRGLGKEGGALNLLDGAGRVPT